MLNKKCLNIIVVSLLFLSVILFTASLTKAQSEEDSKFEVGVQFASINSAVGVGGRLTFNLNRYLALEGEMNWFPSRRLNSNGALQGQFGIKTGYRFKRIGLFGKARPGFINSKRPVPDLSAFAQTAPHPNLDSVPFTSASRTNFSMDIGGVTEFYPTRRFIVRFDVGDLIARHTVTYIQNINPAASLSSFRVTSFNQTSHNIQVNVGVGFRF